MMDTTEQIKNYINSQPEKKQHELLQIHRRIMDLSPEIKLWFLDGKNSEGKTVSNPSIGYGTRENKYADGTSKDFYQIGISANTTGISVYILGIEDKNFLKKNFGADLGKATITGYCIKIKSLADINFEVLIKMIKYGLGYL